MAKTTDNYNLNILASLRQRSKTVSFWFIALLGGAICYLITKWFLNGDVAYFIGLLIGWAVLLISTGPMLKFDEDKLRKFAASNGLAYVGNITFTKAGAERWMHVMTPTILKIGKPKKLEGLIQGNLGDLNLSMFRYTFEFIGDTALYHYQFTLITININTNTFPQVILDSDAITDFKYFFPTGNYERVRLEGEFGNLYQAIIPKSSGNEKRLLALSLFTPDVMEIYQQYFPDCNMSIDNGTITLITRQDIYGTESYDGYFEGLRKLQPKLERQVRIRKTLENTTDSDI